MNEGIENTFKTYILYERQGFEPETFRFQELVMQIPLALPESWVLVLFVSTSAKNTEKKSDKGYHVSRTGFATLWIVFKVNYVTLSKWSRLVIGPVFSRKWC
jgi:hypothetical protein